MTWHKIKNIFLDIFGIREKRILKRIKEKYYFPRYDEISGKEYIIQLIIPKKLRYNEYTGKLMSNFKTFEIVTGTQILRTGRLLIDHIYNKSDLRLLTKMYSKHNLPL